MSKCAISEKQKRNVASILLSHLIVLWLETFKLGLFWVIKVTESKQTSLYRWLLFLLFLGSSKYSEDTENFNGRLSSQWKSLGTLPNGNHCIQLQEINGSKTLTLNFRTFCDPQKYISLYWCVITPWEMEDRNFGQSLPFQV